MLMRGIIKMVKILEVIKIIGYYNHITTTTIRVKHNKKTN
jgi:hypothetical protein